jgi:hypothetical protein
MMPSLIDPKQIRTDLDTQSRVTLNDEVVKEYAEAMEAGAVFPAILVFYDESNDQFILADGFHRYAAHMQVMPNDPILAEQKLGTVEDAQWESIGANQSHGLRRTNEDKRNAITQALMHPKGAELSNRKIAEHVGVAEGTVRIIRKELESTAQIAQSTERTGRDGRTIKTSYIGFGKVKIPENATCADCRYFDTENNRCGDGEDKLPWDAVCDEFAVRVAESPAQKIPPPDYDNIEEADDQPKRKNLRGDIPNRRLKNCIAVYLPPDHPDLFAVELRQQFERNYLVECLIALKRLLSDEGD